MIWLLLGAWVLLSAIALPYLIGMDRRYQAREASRAAHTQNPTITAATPTAAPRANAADPA